MKGKYYALAALGGLVVTTLTVSAVVSAAPVEQNLNPEKLFAQMRESREEMKQIMENEDYAAWSQSLTDRVDKIRQSADELEGLINENTFNILIQAHELMQAGDQEAARQLIKDNELDRIFGPGRFHKRGFPNKLNQQ